MANYYYSRDPQVGRSLQHSVRDGVAYSVMTGAGESYFSAYALFLKASTSQIAALTALPPLLGSLAQLLSAWLGRRTGRRKALILGGATLQCLTWFPIIWLPYAFPEHAVPLLIGCVALYHAAAHFAAPVWSSLMGDLVPVRRRGRYFAWRTRLATISNFISLIAAGLVLNHFDAGDQARLGFAILFSAAVAARIYSTYQISRMHETPSMPHPIGRPSLAQLLRRLRGSRFIRFSLSVTLMNGAVAISAPFFSVHMLRDLKFSYTQFMCNTAMAIIMQFLTLKTWGRLADIFGNRSILAVTSLIIAVLPALWLVSGDFWYLLGAQAIAGIGWAGFNLSAGNSLYDLIPSEKRSTRIAAHNVVNSVGVFLGAMLGAHLAAHTPATVALFGRLVEWSNAFWGVFLASTAARTCAALLFVFLMCGTAQTSRRVDARKLLSRLMRRTSLGVLSNARARRQRAFAPSTSPA